MNIDFGGGTWREIAQWAGEQLDAARRRNDGVDISPEQTAALRGEIRFIKRLLALPEQVARDQQSGPA
jgi:hypothetical protein